MSRSVLLLLFFFLLLLKLAALSLSPLVSIGSRLLLSFVFCSLVEQQKITRAQTSSNERDLTREASV